MLTRTLTLAVAAIALTAAPAAAQSSRPDSRSSQPGQTTPRSGTESPGARTSAGPAVQVDAGSVIGSIVRGTDGRDLGKVSRLMVDPREGRIKSVVVSLGGVLGVGGKTVSVPWESVKLGQDDQKIVVTIEQQLLDSAPAASPGSEERGRGTRQ